MIGLLLLISLGLWIGASVMLSKRIPRWLGIKKHQTTISVLLFPLVLVVPVTDDLIGRWQFYRLCEKEAVLTLSPEWERVKRATRRPSGIGYFDGYLIPFTSTRSEFIDMDTERVFLTTRSMHTPGGFLKRHLYGLGGLTSCHPDDETKIFAQIKLRALLKQGE